MALVGGVHLFKEETLIQKAKEFDSDAWSDIYKRYYHQIYAYLRHRLGDKDVAEDIAASVFLAALEGIGAFTYRGISLSAWLYRIAHNMTVDHFRRRKKELTDPLDEEQIAEKSMPDEVLDRSLARQELAKALKELTDEQQQVILLKFIAGLSNAETAQVIGKPEGAVKSLQHRALASLRHILDGESK